MKKTLEILSASALILGIAFKLFHWPGSDLLLILSLGLFIPIFYLSELVSRWKSTPSKFLILVNFLALFTLMEGILFKLMHWPASDLILTLSFACLLPVYFISKGIIYRKDRKGILLNALFHSIFSICILFVFLNLPGVDTILIFSFLILLIAVIISLLRKESVSLIELNLSESNTKISLLVTFCFLFLLGSRLVSKRILDNESYVQIELQDKFQMEKTLGDRYINEKNKAKANAIDAETAKLIHRIDDVKLDIINNIEDLRVIRRFDKDVVLWKKAEKDKLEIFELNLLAVGNKFNRDVPRHVIVGQGNSYTLGSGIWKSFLTYQDFLLDGMENESLLKTDAEKGALESMRDINTYWKNKEFAEFYDQQNTHWMERTFGSITVIQSIVKLTEMQLEIIRMRNLALSGL
jgi:hypothetical protein